MVTIVFYEKPRCATNARQRKSLQSAGHDVQVRDLLAEPWNPERLLDFFRDLPVRDWFNPAAPRIKSGAIDPARLTPDHALELLLAEPLLIRRPLIEIGAERIAGFDVERLRAIIGLPWSAEGPHLQGCAHAAAASSVLQQGTHFELVGGPAAVERIVEEFYHRMDIEPFARDIRGLHPADLTRSKAALRSYLTEFLGGPAGYSREGEHRRLRLRHLPLRIGPQERDAWMQCMRGALEAVVGSNRLREYLLQSMYRIADWMRNDRVVH